LRSISVIVTGERYVVVSENSNRDYFVDSIYPDWTPVIGFHCHSRQGAGVGVEPHYHDCDEIWLFTVGRGEVWLDGHIYEISPNTVVYTPMGVVHRFQMFTEFENNSLVTRLERHARRRHILVEEDGPPEPTVPGFVVGGPLNAGPFADPGRRCPLREFRAITFAKHQELGDAVLSTNEHWAVRDGEIEITIDGLPVRLWPGDVALLRTGAVRGVRSDTGAHVVLARERPAHNEG
jgi:mannose-6-phosphate isomerase-like protein (cupin superfamily)